MITLYFHAGACSTSNHFALEEAGVAYEAIPVDLRAVDDALTMKVHSLNPMGQLPVVVLDDGNVLTQNVAILPYIADLVPGKKLFPASGTIERVHAESWLSFIAADLHTTLAAEFPWTLLPGNDAARATAGQFWLDRVARRLRILEERLASRDFILGSEYSVIDGYALIVLSWSEPTNLSLAPFPNIQAYMARVSARPAIQRVRQLEGPVSW